MAAQRRDEVVLVTGASRGIGQATAIRFGQEGATVIVNYYRRTDAAEDTMTAVEEVGGRAFLIQADLSAPEEVGHMVAHVEDEIGPIHVLVNNAATFNRDSFLDVTLEEFDRVWQTNVRGLFHLSRLVSSHMAARRQGSIVHVSSLLAQQAIPSRTAYCASKGAIESLTRAMALDLAPFNIRVNAVAPGLSRTDGLLDGISDAALEAKLQRHIPVGRFAEPAEIAETIAFVVSDAASYITGAILPVNGGLGAREAGPK